MSTPLCICQEIPANPNEDNWLPVRVPNPKCLAHEGVAAPLEPLEIAAQKIAEHMGCCVDDIDLVREIFNEFAAAVSKNLQQQNAHLIKEGLRVDADADKRMSRAAKAETELENLQEELALEIKRREHWQELAESLYENASVYLSDISRLEKEIAALRETK